MLYVHEVASLLGATDQHVINLIDEGQLGAINIGGAGRRFWRVPVTSYQEFLTRRSSLSI